MMRIAYDHLVFGNHVYSGITRYITEIASRIATETSNVVAVAVPLYVNKYLQQTPPQLKIIGFPIPKIPKTGRLISSFNNVAEGYLLRSFRPDIVHETNYSRHRYAPKGARIIVTVYDMIHERLPAHFSATERTREEKRIAIERADHVICISESTRRDLLELHRVPADKVSVVHLATRFSSGDDYVEKETSHLGPFLLYVGARSSYKNFDGLIRAYASSIELRSQVRLVCFGGGAFNRAELEYLRQLNLSDGEVHHMAGDDGTLTKLYRSACAFVYPSLYEGFGIPLLEAMALNCPVACSQTSAMPEVAGNAALMFDPENADSIRDCLEKLVNDAELRSELIGRGKARCALFSWGRCAAETLAIYQKFAP